MEATKFLMSSNSFEMVFGFSCVFPTRTSEKIQAVREDFVHFPEMFAPCWLAGYMSCSLQPRITSTSDGLYFA